MSEEEEGDELAVLLASLDEIKEIAASGERYAITTSKDHRSLLHTVTATSNNLNNLTNAFENGLGSLSRQIYTLREDCTRKRSKRVTAAIVGVLVGFGACLGGGGVLIAARMAPTCTLLGGDLTVYEEEQISLCAFRRF